MPGFVFIPPEDFPPVLFLRSAWAAIPLPVQKPARQERSVSAKAVGLLFVKNNAFAAVNALLRVRLMRSAKIMTGISMSVCIAVAVWSIVLMTVLNLGKLIHCGGA